MDNLWENKKQETINKIEEYKLPVEANIVACFYKQPDLLYDYSDLQLKDFSSNDWRVYFAIIYGLVITEKKESITALTIGVYLEKHLKLQEAFDDCGGYSTIEKLIDAINVENLNGYILELDKWNTLISMINDGFPVWENLKKYNDMTLEDIYDENEARLNNIFVKRDGGVRVYDASCGLDELIDKLDKGKMIGLPYYSMPMLTNLTSGCILGNMDIVAMSVNAGKSTFVRNAYVASCILAKERVVIILNEEDEEKFQSEMLCWVANNIYRADIQKYIIRNGKYSPEVKALLKKCAKWLEGNASDKLLTIIPLQSYTTSKAIKIIKKYASLSIKYFCIDTLKSDIEIPLGETRWANLKNNSVKLYNTIKPTGKNVHLLCTYQIAASDKRCHYLDLDNLGESKGIAEVASTVLMVRALLPDEIQEEGKKNKNTLTVRSGDTISEIINLDPNKYYQVLFIAKSRTGEAGRRQIVFEHDMSRNIINEIGYTIVPYSVN